MTTGQWMELKYFQTAARTQNFSQAACELNITQPSLSITISRLEAELKVNLFDRRGRNVTLNEAGAAFLQRVNTVFSELDSAKEELADIAGMQNLKRRENRSGRARKPPFCQKVLY